MKPRRFKWLKRSFLSFVVMFAIVAIGYSWSWYSTRSAGEKKLALAMQELESREPGWRQVVQTRNQTLAPADKNSASKAIACLDSFPQEFKKWNSQFDRTPSEVKSCHLDPPEWLDELKKNLAPHREKIEQLKSFTKTEQNSGFPIEFNETNPIATLLPGRQELRFAAQLLMFECRLQLQENNPDEAVRCCRAIVGLSRAMGDEPFLISQLIRLALNAIALQTMEKMLGCSEPNQGLVELQNELTSLTEFNYLLTGLKGERQTMDALFQSLDESRVDLKFLEQRTATDRSFFSVDGVMWANYRRYVPSQRAEQFELYNQLIAAAGEPFPLRSERLNEVENELKEKTGYHQILINKLTPNFQKINESEKRVKTQLYCAICGIACERFRLKNQRWPKDLNEIPKEILPAVPHDAYDGEPLKLYRTATGLVITNFSEDNFDDILEIEGNGSFTGFRLFDPKFRRQKAKLLTPPKLEEEADRN